MVMNPDNRPEENWWTIGEMYGSAALVGAVDAIGLSHIFNNSIGLNPATGAEVLVSAFPALMTLGAVYSINFPAENERASASRIALNGLTAIGTGIIASHAVSGWEGIVAGIASSAPLALNTYRLTKTRFPRN